MAQVFVQNLNYMQTVTTSQASVMSHVNMNAIRYQATWIFAYESEDNSQIPITQRPCAHLHSAHNMQTICAEVR